MRATFRYLALSASVLLLLASVGFAQPVKPKKAIQPSPSPMYSLTIQNPGGGEDWEIGKNRTISWTSSNVNGNVRLDLYRGGTDPRHKVGTIAASTPVSSGRYSWEAGQRRSEGPAAPGTGYQIAIKADTPAMTRFSAPFNLVPASGTATATSPAAPARTPATTPAPAAMTPVASAGATAMTKDLSSVKLLALTYPRRADLLHKGIPFTITWTSLNLNQAKLKIQLMNIQGTTVIRDIAENYENTGQCKWGPPMDLPDEKTSYKIRIQTMDGSASSTSDLFFIVISSPTNSALSLEVKSPLAGDREVNDTIPVKWTTTINCSAAGVPMDNYFVIDLMDESGSNFVRNLVDGAKDFDGEGPTGILNWHWDWHIPSTQQPGTYMIRVKNWNGECADKSDKFRIFLPREVFYFKPIQISACSKGHPGLPGFSSTYAEQTATLGLTEAGVSGPPDRGLVGVSLVKDPLGHTVDEFTVGSMITFHSNHYWYKQYSEGGRRIVYALLIIKRVWKLPNAAGGFGRCLDQINVLDVKATCYDYYAQGVPIQVQSNQDGTWELSLTGAYEQLISRERPDYGIVINHRGWNFGLDWPGPKHYRDAETYDVTLKVEVELEQ